MRTVVLVYSHSIDVDKLVSKGSNQAETDNLAITKTKTRRTRVGYRYAIHNFNRPISSDKEI